MFLRRDESSELSKITGLPYEYCNFEWNKKNMFSDKKKSFNPSLFGDYGSLIGGVKGEPKKDKVIDYMVKEKGFSVESALFKLNSPKIDNIFVDGKIRSIGSNASFVMKGF